MIEQPQKKPWWQTLPAILTGLATLVAAVTGLLVALQQNGFLSHSDPVDAATGTPVEQPGETPSTRPTDNSSSHEVSGASGFRVADVELRADPFNYRGHCPVKIEFSGRVSVIGSGTVSYRFQRSDGAKGPVQTLHFSESGSQRVTTTWQLGGANPNFQPFKGAETLVILAPDGGEPKTASFQIYCN